jgi:hypothetical protein
MAYLRAAWRLLRRDAFVRRNFGGAHFVPLDGTCRGVVDMSSLCGVRIGCAGDATTQPSVVGCWRCALAVARDPERWTPTPRARWETSPDGTTVCRTCRGYLQYRPGCSCRKSVRQGLEQGLLTCANRLRFAHALRPSEGEGRSPQTSLGRRLERTLLACAGTLGAERLRGRPEARVSWE